MVGKPGHDGGEVKAGEVDEEDPGDELKRVKRQTPPVSPTLAAIRHLPTRPHLKDHTKEELYSNESISLSSSKSYMRGEIGNVTEVNLVRK